MFLENSFILWMGELLYFWLSFSSQNNVPYLSHPYHWRHFLFSPKKKNIIDVMLDLLFVESKSTKMLLSLIFVNKTKQKVQFILTFTLITIILTVFGCWKWWNWNLIFFSILFSHLMISCALFTRQISSWNWSLTFSFSSSSFFLKWIFLLLSFDW